MPEFSFQNHKVHYVEAGQGEPLVFLHNGGNDHQIWEHQLAHFATTHRVIATDHLGFGASDKPQVELTLPLYGEMVAALVDELALAPVTLIGNCMGSAMAFHYTLHHPDKVKRLVLCNITSEKILLAGPLASIYQQFSASKEGRDAYSTQIEATGLPREETDRQLRSQYGATPPDDPAFSEYIFGLYNLPGQQRSLFNVLSNFDNYRTPDEFILPENFPPTCVIWGQENFILPATAGEEFCARLQPTHKEFLPGCGHLLMREKAAEVNQIIESFLTRPLTQTHKHNLVA
ncbi:MAG: alpha/beta hydrolase [Acidobacteria bacterium]|nr:alpha/beta hydrolase [Acidobacteriota bacterium]